MLAFVPQNLKLDGSFHSLKVTLKNPQKLTLQARRGYYAPKNFASPDEQAKQEIVDAMYSQEELHNLPVNLHTQFFKASDQDATLVVLAHVDVKRLRFRKVEGRNDNVLTCVSALFNRNGNFVQGMEKTVTMKLKDETLEHKLGLRNYAQDQLRRKAGELSGQTGGKGRGRTNDVRGKWDS